MNRDRLDPILQGLCYAYDYDKDSVVKANEIKGQLFALGAELDKQTTLKALYAIIHTSLKLVEELEGVTFDEVDEDIKEIENV